MAEKKNLKINAALCDLRGVSEEMLQNYGKVMISAATVFVSQRVQELLYRYGVEMNAANIMKLREEEEVKCQNGQFIIGAGQAAGTHTCLLVNGQLTIGTDGEEAVKSYKRILVNGSVLCPTNLSGLLADKLEGNARLELYPQDYRLLQGDLEIDRLFILRAKPESKYYVTGTARFLDPDADYGALTGKNVQIHTGSALIMEKAVDVVASVLNEEASVKVVPDGYYYQSGGAVMEEGFVAKTGRKVLIDGDLEIRDSAEMEKLDALEVSGSVLLQEKDRKAFLEVCKTYGALRLFRGRLLKDIPELMIDRGMLESALEGLTVVDCVSVTLAEDVTAQLIEERLQLIGCVSVSCPKGLKGVVNLNSVDLVSIEEKEEEEGAAGEDAESNTVQINTAMYVI